MRPSELIATTIREKIQKSTVVVDVEANGLIVTVTAEAFTGQPRADCQAEVYRALERLPLELVARVREINCRS